MDCVLLWLFSWKNNKSSMIWKIDHRAVAAAWLVVKERKKALKLERSASKRALLKHKICYTHWWTHRYIGGTCTQRMIAWEKIWKSKQLLCVCPASLIHPLIKLQKPSNDIIFPSSHSCVLPGGEFAIHSAMVYVLMLSVCYFRCQGRHKELYSNLKHLMQRSPLFSCS